MRVPRIFPSVSPSMTYSKSISWFLQKWLLLITELSFGGMVIQSVTQAGILGFTHNSSLSYSCHIHLPKSSPLLLHNIFKFYVLHPNPTTDLWTLFIFILSRLYSLITNTTMFPHTVNGLRLSFKLNFYICFEKRLEKDGMKLLINQVILCWTFASSYIV